MDEKKAPVSSAAARLHVMLARDAPFAVILRRGPPKQVCTIGWHLNDDTFQVGQWLKGRVDEHFCDLSPDGEHLLYRADKYSSSDEGLLEYTVLSRAPHLKALKIWKGKSFYGGVFLSNDRFALHEWGSFGSKPEPRIFRVAPFGEVKNEAELAQIERPPHAFHWRFERDGWKGSNALHTSSSVEWIKEFAGWELKWAVRGAGVTYAVRGRRLEKTFDCARWQWADFREKRVLWAQEGKVFAAQIGEDGHGPIEELADFNNWTFEPIAAPY